GRGARTTGSAREADVISTQRTRRRCRRSPRHRRLVASRSSREPTSPASQLTQRAARPARCMSKTARSICSRRMSCSSPVTRMNVRMLLLSKSKPYPNGLSNNHGQGGKHYMTHNTLAGVTALFPWNLNTWYGLPAQGVAVDNWADDNFDHASLDFIGGGNLWVYTERRPIFAASMATFGKAPAWGSAWKAFIKQNADRWNSAYLQKTTLPYEDNYLDLDPAVKDPLGFPVCRITADHKDNERKLGAFIQDKMVQWFMEAGAIAVEKGPMGTMGPSTHAYGGTRMGEHAETTVV